MPKETICQSAPTVLSPEEQMEALRHRLAGHQVYRRARGSKGSFGRMPLDELLKESNPTATLKAFQEWTADQSVMLNMLATLKRDGYAHAHDELLASLVSNHVILGEGFPIEETYPGVFVMFEPEKTLLLTRWLYTSDFKDDALYWIKNGCGDPQRGLCGSLTPDLFATFPDFLEFLEKQKHSHHVASPTSLFFESTLKPYWDKLEKFKQQHMYEREGIDRHALFVDPDHTDLWYWCKCVAAFMSGTTRKDILGPVFDRDEQKNIATWRFDLPKIVIGLNSGCWDPNYWLGLHPEEEHEHWTKIYPSYVSRGVSHGLGAIVLDKNMFGKYHIKDSRKHVPEYSVLGRPYPENITGAIERQRMALTFPFER